MRIISHRGIGFGAEQNTLEAFKESFNFGFGTETDIRDYNGKLVVSHDIADAASMSADEFFAIAKGYPHCELAINIKADGIGGLLREALSLQRITRYFVFDMSVPQMIEYRGIGLRYFSRQSEYETSPVLLDDADGVWVDSFLTDKWIDSRLIQGYIAGSKTVCIVSPELHKRNHKDLWQRLKDIEHGKLMLCTDYPIEADRFFNGGGT